MEKVESPERMVGVDELSARYDWPKSWIYQAAASGLIPAFKTGKYVRFRLSEIERWLQTRRTGGE